MSNHAFIRRAGALAATLALAVTSTLGLAACGGPSVEETIKKQVVTDLDQIKSASADEIKDVLGQDEWDSLSSSGIDVEKFYNACVKHFSYEEPAVTVDGDTATVTINVTNVDIKQVFANWESEALEYAGSEEAQSDYESIGEDGIMEKVFEMLYSKLDADDAPLTTADVQIDFKKDSDGSWVPSDESQLGSVLFAGVDPSTIETE